MLPNTDDTSVWTVRGQLLVKTMKDNDNEKNHFNITSQMSAPLSGLNVMPFYSLSFTFSIVHNQSQLLFCKEHLPSKHIELWRSIYSAVLKSPSRPSNTWSHHKSPFYPNWLNNLTMSWKQMFTAYVRGIFKAVDNCKTVQVFTFASSTLLNTMSSSNTVFYISTMQLMLNYTTIITK